ncbi:MAG: OmpA family protein [Zoogloeaceae bacterium]|jgi:outer membrane protein OmpA-like peptidoglycan-associated protein|nr:OmpA family protein [Zoogloeaceae bacterium]
MAGGERKQRRGGESPFWISYSDLMTALMALFLTALTAALLSVTDDIAVVADQKQLREQQIDDFMADIKKAAERFPGVTVRGRVVDFGDRARFATDSDRVDAAQSALLRGVVGQMLTLARNPVAEKWLKRIVVEGYADPRGGYLYNLDLSLRRSERVLCVLLAPEGLSEADQALTRKLFRVSGASFNALKASDEASRRIELRLEFLEHGETPPERADAASATIEPVCPLERR